MKKLIFLSIVLMGLTASAQTTISYPGRLINNEGEITVDDKGNTTLKFKCDPFYQNEACMKVETNGPVLMPRPTLTLTLFKNNTISNVLQIENYKGMDYKESSRETEVSIYYNPTEQNYNNN